MIVLDISLIFDACYCDDIFVTTNKGQISDILQKILYVNIGWQSQQLQGGTAIVLPKFAIVTNNVMVLMSCHVKCDACDLSHQYS